AAWPVVRDTGGDPHARAPRCRCRRDVDGARGGSGPGTGREVSRILIYHQPGLRHLPGPAVASGSVGGGAAGGTRARASCEGGGASALGPAAYDPSPQGVRPVTPSSPACYRPAEANLPATCSFDAWLPPRKLLRRRRRV